MPASIKQCIFRYKTGQRCNVLCEKSSECCCQHKRSFRTYHTYLCDLPDLLCYNDLQDIYSRVHNKGNVTELFGNIFTTKELLGFCQKLGLQLNSRSQKSDIVHGLVQALHRFHEAFNKTCSIRNAIRYLQSKVKQSIGTSALSEAKHTKTPINETDIFTLEPISSLPSESIFTYEDGHGSVYAFSAPDLDYSIRTLGPWNPYTREVIPEADLIRLSAILDKSGRKATPMLEDLWRTPSDAFTYVLHYFEQHGFRCEVEWFLKLRPLHIIHIFYHFHALAMPYSDSFFDLDLMNEVSHDDLPFALAKAMLELIKAESHPRQFYLICNFFVSAARVSKAIHRSLPNWIFVGATG